MRIVTALFLMALTSLLLSSGADAWWGSRRRRRRRRSTPPPSCGAVNCVYTWGEASLCNSAGKSRSYANVVSRESCGGSTCPEFKEDNCSPPNGRYTFSIGSSWSTGANSQLAIVLKESQTDSLIIEMCFASAQKITSAWPLPMHHVDEEGKCFYFMQPEGYAPIPAGKKIVANYISTRNAGEAVSKPWKITFHGNCVARISDLRVTGSGETPDEQCDKDESFFADSQDCAKYYQCVSTSEGLGKKAMSMSCPAGTKWDDDYKTCAHGECGQEKMRYTMCDGGECPANMYSETLYPAYP